MIEIIPAIMPKNLGELETATRSVSGATSFVQVDVMDGKFVPPVSWPFPNVEREAAPFKDESAGLPEWENLNYEFDLMIHSPENFIETLIAIGASRLIFHYESTDPDNLREMIKKTKNFMTEAGIAINIDTGNSVLDEFISTDIPADLIQFMGIDRIGYQGESFDENVIPKISALRKKYPDIIISVDGGVNLESAPRLVASGANRLVVGSAIFQSENVREAIRQFQSLN